MCKIKYMIKVVFLTQPTRFTHTDCDYDDKYASNDLQEKPLPVEIFF